MSFVFSVPLWWVAIAGKIHHRVTKNTEDAQRLITLPKRLLVGCVDVTHTAHSLDAFNIALLVAQFFAQVADMHIDTAVKR